MQVVVLGMHRSGTSMVSRLLNIIGFHLGDEHELMQPRIDNPSGFWERKDVCELNEEVLKEAGSTWDTVTGEEIDRLRPSKKAEFSTRIAEILETMDVSRQWVLKDPRFCSLLPLWRGLLQAPVVIFVSREPAQIVASLESRNGLSRLLGVALCESYFLAFLKAARGLPKIFVRHEDLLSDPFGVACTLCDRLEDLGASGLRRSCRDEVESYIDTSLFRSRVDAHLISDFLNDQRKRLFAELASGRPSDAWTQAELSQDSLDALSMLRDVRDVKHLTARLEREGDELRRAHIDLGHRKTEVEKMLETLREENRHLAEQRDEVHRGNLLAERAIAISRDLDDRLGAVSEKVGVMAAETTTGLEVLRREVEQRDGDSRTRRDRLQATIETIGPRLDQLTEESERVVRSLIQSNHLLEERLDTVRSEAQTWEDRSEKGRMELLKIHQSKFWRLWMAYHKVRRRILHPLSNNRESEDRDNAPSEVSG